MDWTIDRDGGDLFIAGYGGVDIEIKDFDSSKVVIKEARCETLGFADGLFEEWWYRTWDCEISPGVLLVLFTSWDAKQPGSERHYLELCQASWFARWDVPTEFAETLYAQTS